MRIIILNQFFYPDHSATSQLMTDLAESLVEKGITVTAIAGRGRYDGGGKLAARGDYRGVRIARAWASGFGKRTVAGRLADYLSFYIGATWTLLRQPRHDIVMALTTPPLIGLVALLVARLRRMRLVALVQDVYPDIAVALGTLNANSLLTRALDRLNRFVLRKADRVIVLSECMRRHVVSKIGPEDETRIDVIHNWADGSIQPLGEDENPFRADHNLGDAFVIMFSGNWGRVNDFQTVLEAARLLRERRDILFLFVGNGGRAGELQSFCTRHRLDNVRTLAYQPREMLRFSLAAADVSLITLAPGLAGLSVPSKTYGIMAAARPILFVGDLSSEIASIINENGCGTVISSGESEKLARLIDAWSQDKTPLVQAGRRARMIFEKSFDRSHAVMAYIRSFEKCLSQSGSIVPRYEQSDAVRPKRSQGTPV
ncbi:MAG TPA: glycosyltransferase family 4 protein [Blastocatellia bacterium]|nr:glycosyltransferase family 4 protein [Blastocatellia bacterium]